MGLFNFSRDAGEALRGALGMGGPDDKDLKQALQKHGVTLDNLSLQVKGETVTIGGVADSQAEKEKAILIVGNVKGVEKVEENIQVRQQAARQTSAPISGPAVASRPTSTAPTGGGNWAAENASQFYTVVSGDTLSKIAQRFYGSPQQYQTIFEANRPMLKDPDEIYPGQVLRIPARH